MLKAATVAALAASAGDFLMLATATGRLASVGSAGFTYALLWLGGALGAVAIPLYFWGYRDCTRLLAADSIVTRRMIIAAGAGVAVFGAITHALTAVDLHAAIVAGTAMRPPNEAFAIAFSPLFLAGATAAFCAIVATSAFCWGVWRSPQESARHVTLFNPILATLALAAAGAATGTYSELLVPAAPNLAHGVFFFACRVALTRARAT